MNIKKVVCLTSFGSGLEYYDFVIYALLADFISVNFFPNINYQISLMETFAVFGIGYIVRPIGGIIFGIIGDRVGRKKIFTITIFLMAISTFLMSIMPTYSDIGIMSPLIFILLRIFQGISYGAELPGSLTFLVEHTNNKNRGRNCGLMVASMSVGVTIASFISYAVTVFLSNEQMNSWGFRVPFMLGGVLAIVGYFLRKHTTETPLFSKVKKESIFVGIAKRNRKNLFRGLGFMVFPASFVVFGLFMPSYLHNYFKYELSSIYLMNTLGGILASILIPFLGHFSDYVGRKRLFLIILIMIMLFIFPLFSMLAYKKNIFILCSFIFCYHAMIAGLASCYFAMLAENFETQIRYTGIAFCYNVAYTAAAFIPAGLSYICKLISSPENVSVIFILLALITTLSVILAQEKAGEGLS